MSEQGPELASQKRASGKAYSREVIRDGKVPLSTKIYQGIGAIPDTFKNFAFNTFLLFYYNQVLGMPAVYASAAIMVALIVDAVSDPLVGAYSDGLQTRFGRRHLLMYCAAIPLGISLYLVFTPPAGLTEFGHFLWLTVFAVATRLSMTFYLVPYSALFAEFSDDYEERSAIVTFRYLCAWIAGVTFTFCAWTFIFPSSPEFTPGHLNPEAYRTFAPIVGLMVAAAALFSTHFTRREVPYLLQPTAKTDFNLKGAFADILLSLGNKDFVVLLIAILMSFTLAGTLGALEIYLNTYFWGLAPEDLRWFTLTIFGSMGAFVCLPFLQARFDKKIMLIVCLFFLLANGIAMIGLRFLDLLPPNGELLLLQILIANEIVRIFAFTIVGIMFTSMIADALDKQELDTGRRQEGVFASALSFAAKATSGVGIFFGGLILDYALAFPRKATPESVSPDMIFSLGFVAGIAIPLLYVVPYWLISRYSITREMYTDIQAELTIRRNETD